MDIVIALLATLFVIGVCVAAAVLPDSPPPPHPRRHSVLYRMPRRHFRPRHHCPPGIHKSVHIHIEPTHHHVPPHIHKGPHEPKL